MNFLESRRFRRLGGIEEIEVTQRIITATNCSLAEKIDEGRFREDLYHRLNVVPSRALPADREGHSEHDCGGLSRA